MVDGRLCQQVRPAFDVPVAPVLMIDHRAGDDIDVALLAQHIEVAHGAEVDVRRVVPLIGHEVGHRHSALGQQVQSADSNCGCSLFINERDGFAYGFILAKHTNMCIYINRISHTFLKPIESAQI